METYIRNSYRTHISLSALADRKSNIMVRLNSVLIGLAIVFFKSFLDVNHPGTVVPVVIFLLTALVSMVFAALAARPHITRNKTVPGTAASDSRRNMFFYGNFVDLDLAEYEGNMRVLREQAEQMYDDMFRDIYFLGRVLDKKFRLLQYSYTIFIAGLVLSVGVFLLTLLLSVI
ncbi:MAG: hypothetical protein RLY31_118 [Bacteroidota bacterium]